MPCIRTLRKGETLTVGDDIHIAISDNSRAPRVTLIVEAPKDKIIRGSLRWQDVLLGLRIATEYSANDAEKARIARQLDIVGRIAEDQAAAARAAASDPR